MISSCVPSYDFNKKGGEGARVGKKSGTGGLPQARQKGNIGGLKGLFSFLKGDKINGT